MARNTCEVDEESSVTRRDRARYDVELEMEGFSLCLSRAHSAYPALLDPARCGGCLVVSSYCFPPPPPRPHTAPVLSSGVLSHGALIKAKDRICTVNWCSEQRRSFHSLCLWGSFVPSWNNSRPPFLPSHCSYSAAWETPRWGRR